VPLGERTSPRFSATEGRTSDLGTETHRQNPLQPIETRTVNMTIGRLERQGGRSPSKIKGLTQPYTPSSRFT
jgi:hypothetical protein